MSPIDIIMPLNTDTTTILCPLPYLNTLSVSGPDATTFLQGQVSCNVNDATETHSVLGCCCNPKGRVVSLFRLLQQDKHHYFLQLPSAILGSTQSHLQKYAIFSKVTLAETSKLHSVGLAGKDADTLLNDITGEIPEQINAVTHYQDVTIVRISSSDATPQPRFMLIGSEASLLKLCEALQPHTDTGTPEDWQLLDIFAGLPSLAPETVERFLPHDLNLPELGAVNFQKGCYTGQEIVARMHYRGKPKRHMVQIGIGSTENVCPNPGDLVAHDALGENNTVVAAVSDAPEHCQALVVTQRN